MWSVVRVPTEADEDARHTHRELSTLKKERTRHANRIKGLLIGQGVRVEKIGGDGFRAWLDTVAKWDGRTARRGAQGAGRP